MNKFLVTRKSGKFEVIVSDESFKAFLGNIQGCEDDEIRCGEYIAIWKDSRGGWIAEFDKMIDGLA